MLKRIYINNYRSFQNFTFNFEDQKTALLLGKNGSGKSNLFNVIEIFQKIGRNESRVENLFTEKDFAFNDTKLPINIEIQVELNNQDFLYKIEVVYSEKTKAIRLNKEQLNISGKEVLKRIDSKTTFYQATNNINEFSLDITHLGLPLLSSENMDNQVDSFKTFLAEIIILSPNPTQILATTKDDGLYLNRTADNYLDWQMNLLSERPSSYQYAVDFIQSRMPDFVQFKFEKLGKKEKELLITFKGEHGKDLELNFNQLSDGEKIFILSAGVLSSIKNNSSKLCLWDEPDHYISLPELNQFLTSFRKEFSNSNSQLIMASHNAKFINGFSEHNTYFLSRKNHLHPTRIELIKDKQYLSPTLVDAYENGELEDGS